MRVLVCGDAMADIYWRGNVSRVSPEGPVPIVSVTEKEKRDGAAANVANSVEALGIPCERIFGGGERIQKIRLIARSQHVVRVDFDHPQTPIRADAAYEDALSRCEIVVFVDYAKGSLADIQPLIAKAKEMRRLIFVDPRGHDFTKYRGATMIKPNREEMKELVGGWSTQDELDFKARQFLVSSGIESILLTQAAEGMTLYTRQDTLHVKADNGAVVDVSGAGEAAMAGYTAAIAKGYKPLEAVAFANKAAGIAVGRFGTAIVKEEEVFLKGES